jgi:hypothetical protein
MSDLRAQIAVIDREVATAVHAIISDTQAALDLMGDARRGDAAAFDGVEAALLAILQACAFQDLTGQRLSRLAESNAPSARRAPRDPLLNGPADDGGGLDQAAADRLFEVGEPSR